MKKIKYIFLIGLFFSSLAFANVNRIALTDPNKPILITPQARVFQINLSSNPSTGYAWYLRQYDPLILTPVKQSFTKMTIAIPGASGIESFFFEVNKEAFRVKRITPITFFYLRPWNMDIGKSIMFNLIFL